MYDYLNKLTVGFMILLPFLGGCHNITCGIGLLVLWIASWLVGLLLWGIINGLENCSSKYFPWLGKNNLKFIQQQYDVKYTFWNPAQKIAPLTLKEYFTAYYKIQCKGLLGNIPALESLSAFCKNLVFVGVIWFVVVPFRIFCCDGVCTMGFFDIKICVIYLTQKPMEGLPLILFLILLAIAVPVFILLRRQIELKIHGLVWDAYFCLETQKII